MDEAESDDETVPDLFFETIESSSGWTDITAHPPVSIDNIHKYFVTTRLRRDDVTACKPFEKGYRIFHAGYVQTVAIHAVSNESTYCIVRAMVLPSQRQNPQYKTAVGIIKTTGEVKHGTVHALQERAPLATMWLLCYFTSMMLIESKQLHVLLLPVLHYHAHGKYQKQHILSTSRNHL